MAEIPNSRGRKMSGKDAPMVLAEDSLPDRVLEDPRQKQILVRFVRWNLGAGLRLGRWGSWKARR